MDKFEGLNAIARRELAWSRRGSVQPCSACGLPDYARFLGVKAGVGQWEELRAHSLEECRARQRAQER